MVIYLFIRNFVATSLVARSCLGAKLVASEVHNRFVAIELLTSVAVELCSSLRATDEMEVKQETGKGYCGAGFCRSPPSIFSGNLNTNTEVTLVSLGGIHQKVEN